MAQEPSRPPFEVLMSIEQKSLNVREAATALSKRIEQFQEYLATVPGRVETICYGDHPDAETPQEQAELSLGLRLQRQGKKWVLLCGSFHEYHNGAMEEPINYELLKDAPLKFKIAAVRMFPKLLEQIEKSQDELVAELKKVADEYDNFAVMLPLKAGK